MITLTMSNFNSNNYDTIKTTKTKTPVTMTTTATTTTTGQKNSNICNNNNNKKGSKTNNGFRIEIFLQIQNKAVAKNKCYIFSDAFKLCYIHQRPFPQRVDSIGSWQTAMEVLLSLLSTF